MPISSCFRVVLLKDILAIMSINDTESRNRSRLSKTRFIAHSQKGLARLSPSDRRLRLIACAKPLGRCRAMVYSSGNPYLEMPWITETARTHHRAGHHRIETRTPDREAGGQAPQARRRARKRHSAGAPLRGVRTPRQRTRPRARGPHVNKRHGKRIASNLATPPTPRATRRLTATGACLHRRERRAPEGSGSSSLPSCSYSSSC